MTFQGATRLHSPTPRRLCSIRLKQRCRCLSTTGEIVVASSYVFLVLFTCPSHQLSCRIFLFFFLGACFICTSPGNVTLQRNSQLEPCVCHIAENDWISEKAAVKKMWSSICRHQSLFFFASKQTQLQPCGAFLHCFSARKNGLTQYQSSAVAPPTGRASRPLCQFMAAGVFVIPGALARGPESLVSVRGLRLARAEWRREERVRAGGRWVRREW